MLSTLPKVTACTPTAPFSTALQLVLYLPGVTLAAHMSIPSPYPFLAPCSGAPKSGAQSALNVCLRQDRGRHLAYFHWGEFKVDACPKDLTCKW